MKRLFNLMAVVAMLFAGAACTNHDGDETMPTPVLTIDECQTIDVAGQTVSLAYEIKNSRPGVELTASEPSESWIHDVVVEEENIVFIVDAYQPAFDAEQRTGSFELTYGALITHVVTVMQSAPVTTLEVVSPEAHSSAAAQAHFEYQITNPVEGVKLVVSEPTVEWLYGVEVDEQSSQVLFNLKEYDAEYDAEPRSTTLELTYGELDPQTVTITQNAPVSPFAVSFEELTPKSATVYVVPTDATMSYFVQKTTKEKVAAAESLAALVLADAINKDSSLIYDIEDYLATGNYPVEGNYMLNGKFEWSESEVAGACVYVCGVARNEQNEIVLTTRPLLVEVPLVPWPALTISPEQAEKFSVEAGTCSFNYEVKNPMEGEQVKAVASEKAPWVHDVVVNENGTISFSYDANPYNVERSGEIVITYNSYTDTCKFKFSQAANTAAESVEFNIEVISAHFNRVIVNCTPSSTTANYVLGVVSKKKFESYNYNSDPLKIPEVDLGSAAKPATIQGAQTNYAVTGVNIDHSSYGGLDWYVYAYAVDDAATIAISEVKMVAVTVVDDRPSLTWDDSQVYQTTSFFGSVTNNLDAAAASKTYTLKYTLTNPVEGGGVVKASASSNYYGVIDETSLVVDQLAQTVSFKINDYNPDEYSHVGTLTLGYYSSDSATKADAEISVKITQKAE